VIDAAQLHDDLLSAYGPQGWWPADDLFEIMLGALLVQRTAWSNAAAAIGALQRQGLITPAALAAADPEEVERCCRPAGFFRSKAARLQGLSRFLIEVCSLDELRSRDTADLRNELLARDGIGPETADAILLYGFERPAVVVDEYLRRLHRRLEGATRPVGDARLRAWVESDLSGVAELNELHALVVAHGKEVCRTRPLCRQCQLLGVCRTGRGGSDAELGEGVGDFAQNS